MRKTRRAGLIAMFIAVALVALLLVTVTSAFAAAPPVVGGDSPTGYFLCPAVGGPNAGGPLPGGQNTFLPGHNQAGLHVNVNGTNGDGAPGDSPGPGNGNSNWSPIWNANISG
jgi:hypothetical protein